MKKFLLKSGPLNRSRWLILQPHQLLFEAHDAVGAEYITIPKANIADIKHGIVWMQWYKFFVGRRYTISIKSHDDRVLHVSFASHFGLRKDYEGIYTDIVDTLWEYYLNDMANGIADELKNGGELVLQQIRVSLEGVFISQQSVTPWNELATQDYERYFAIFKKADATAHKLVTFNEWGAELLWALCKKFVVP